MSYEIIIQELVTGQGFFLTMLLQLGFSMLLMRSKLMSFVVGVLNIISAVYYTSIVDVASIKMMGVVLVAVLGGFQLLFGWE